MGWIARPRLARRRGTLTAGLTLGLVFAVAVSAAAVSAQQSARMQSPAFLRTLKDVHRSSSFWAKAAKPRRAARQKAALSASKVRAYRLNTARLKSVLARAPRERTTAARTNPLVVSLPAPNGTFQRFVLQQSAIMAPGLAKRHPEIKTYCGRGIDDPTATIQADLSPLGFHASVRSAQGAWYIDPYYRPRARASTAATTAATSTETARHLRRARRRRGRALGRPAATTTPPTPSPSTASGFDGERGHHDHDHRSGGELRQRARVSAPRTGSARSRRASSRTRRQPRYAHRRGERRRRVGLGELPGRARRRSDHRPADRRPAPHLPAGADHRPGLRRVLGGPANVTAAKVTLMNRVTQVYEDDMSIRMRLIANNDLLNLNTLGPGDRAQRALRRRGVLHAEPASPAARSTTRATASSIGQIIGASQLRHRPPRARRSPAAASPTSASSAAPTRPSGCTGIPTPVGDFYAVDYVAHEMGHQFAGNHPFNGNQLNCSGGNRNAAHLGRAGQRLLDHGLRGHLPRPTTCSRTATRTSRSAA